MSKNESKASPWENIPPMIVEWAEKMNQEGGGIPTYVRGNYHTMLKNVGGFIDAQIKVYEKTLAKNKVVGTIKPKK